MNPDIHSADVERQTSAGVQDSAEAFPRVPDFQDRAGHGCFLCLESPRQGQYAVLVPCLRPTEAREEKMLVYDTDDTDDTDDTRAKYVPVAPWDRACESDQDIYQRLVDTCYQRLGGWKRWLPYYGVVKVREVKFRFDDSVKPDGSYPIQIIPIDLEAVSKDCKKALSCGPMPDSVPDLQCYLQQHTQKCEFNWAVHSRQCVFKELVDAEERLDRISTLSLLTKCGQNPAKANGAKTLEGMAQEGCIYKIRGFRQVNLPDPNGYFTYSGGTMRGLQFVLGWQSDRIKVQVPFMATCAWLGIAFVWLCLALWKGTGSDRAMALAFAHVVAATVSMVLLAVEQ